MTVGDPRERAAELAPTRVHMMREEAATHAPRASAATTVRLVDSLRSVWQRALVAPQIILLLFVILTLPLEFTKQIFPIQEIEVARIGMVACIGWLGWHAVRRGLRPIPLPIAAVVVFILLTSVISLALTRWPGGPKDVIAVVAYALFGLFVAQTIRTGRDLAIAAVALAVSGAVVGGVAVAQELADFYIWTIRPGLETLGRRNSTFGDPNIAARQLGISLFAVLALVAATPGRRLVRPQLFIPLAAALVVIGSGMLLTLSRSGWLLTAIVIAVLWVPFSVRRGQTLLAVGVFVAGFIVTGILNPSASVRLGEMASLVGARPTPPTPPATPYLILPAGDVPIDPSRQLLSWGANERYEAAVLQTEATIEIVDADGTLTEPPRVVPARPGRDFIGTRLEDFESLANRQVIGPASVSAGEPRHGDASLAISVSGLEADQRVVVSGDRLRDDVSGISGGAPLRVWVNASDLHRLKIVELVFHFRPVMRNPPPENYIAYRITPSVAGQWQEITLPRSAYSSAAGASDWAHVMRIDVRIEAGPEGTYSGTVSVDDVRIGSALEPGETYGWRVKVANEKGYSGYTSFGHFQVRGGAPEPARFTTEVARSTFLSPIVNRLPLDDVRQYQVNGAVAMFLDQPLFGVGLGGADEMLVDRYREFIPPGYRDAPIALVHVELARIGAELGAVGLALYAAFLVVGLFMLRSLSRAEPPIGRIAALGLFSGLLLIVLSSQSEGRFYNEPYLWLLAGALAGVLAGLRPGLRTGSLPWRRLLPRPAS